MQFGAARVFMWSASATTMCTAEVPESVRSFAAPAAAVKVSVLFANESVDAAAGATGARRAASVAASRTRLMARTLALTQAYGSGRRGALGEDVVAFELRGQ